MPEWFQEWSIKFMKQMSTKIDGAKTELITELSAKLDVAKIELSTELGAKLDVAKTDLSKEARTKHDTSIENLSAKVDTTNANLERHISKSSKEKQKINTKITNWQTTLSTLCGALHTEINKQCNLIIKEVLEHFKEVDQKVKQIKDSTEQQLMKVNEQISDTPSLLNVLGQGRVSNIMALPDSIFATLDERCNVSDMLHTFCTATLCF